MFKRSSPARALRDAASRHTILISEPLWQELTLVLQRVKFRKYFTVEEREAFLDFLAFKGEWVSITSRCEVCRDPKDNMILDLAVSGQADCIISGDQDLLVLDPFQGIRIVTPATFLEML